MIHGQVAVKWSRVLNVDRILVGNDEAAGNELIKKSLLMASPNTVKTAIRTVDDAIRMLNDPRIAEHKVLVIVNHPNDLLKILQNVKIEKVNIGSFGRIASRRGTEARKRYALDLYLYDDEADVLRQCLKYTDKAVYQVMPDYAPEDLEKVLG